MGILSNSHGREYTNHKQLFKDICGVPFINYIDKKPDNFVEVLSYFTNLNGLPFPLPESPKPNQ